MKISNHEDYIFVDAATGQEYISTPLAGEMDAIGQVMMILMIAILAQAIILGIFFK